MLSPIVFKVVLLPVVILNNNIPVSEIPDLNSVVEQIIKDETVPSCANNVGDILMVPNNTPEMQIDPNRVRKTVTHIHNPYGTYIVRLNGRPVPFKGPSTKVVIRYVK